MTTMASSQYTILQIHQTQDIKRGNKSTMNSAKWKVKRGSISFS